jgi:UDP:flavonoid glycosyltransferase YjiC (YdhE family)
MLVPVGFFSAYDGTELPLPPLLSAPFRWLGPKSRSAYLKLGARATRFLAEPWYRLRAELGLPPATDVNPLGDSHSPELVLALFSKVLANRQPDWPRQTVVTGFPYAPGAAGVDLPPELDRFLDAGPPPIVFTLGTVVGFDPGRFYDVSLAAARELGCRAVLIGSGAPKRLATGDDAICCDYAPFGALLPRASVVVHHGGIGTTGLAMRAGRPMLVMPTAWDQPDNAARAARLGVARVIPRPRYSPSRVASELLRLQSDEYRRRASAVGDRTKQEGGVRAACDAIESHLDRATPSARSV